METMRPHIQRIHDTPYKTVLAVSGAGTQAVAWLLGVSGASRTILEVVVPYGRLAMQDFLGFEPSQSAAAETARQLAKRAYQRARAQLEAPSTGPGQATPVVGLACAAAIATDRYRRGEHRAFVAAWDATMTATWSLTFHKGLRDRAGEEDVVSRLIVLALSEFSGLNPVSFEGEGRSEGEIGGAAWTDILGLTAGDSLEVERTPRPEPLEELLAGDIRWVARRPDGGMEAEGNVPPVLLPGSFNPLHIGHREMMETAIRSTSGLHPALVAEAEPVVHPEPVEGAFELSVTNVDKPPLEKGEILRRLAQFGPEDTVVLTRAETFQKKAALFPGRVFVQGWDTTVRLVAPRYYGGEPEMMRALAEMMASGTSFLVAGRDDGVFRTLADVDIPAGFAPMFSEMPEREFRRDISSTELRQSQSPEKGGHASVREER